MVRGSGLEICTQMPVLKEEVIDVLKTKTLIQTHAECIRSHTQAQCRSNETYRRL